MSGEASHGGIDWDELECHGIDPQSIVDLSSNILFVDHPEAVRRAIQSAAVSRYPDRNCGPLCQALAQRHAISPNRILAGNGCSELIHLVAGAFLKTDDSALVVGPTFAEYQRASQLAGATVREVPARTEDGFAVPVEAIEHELGRSNYQIVWLCNPNNPTGQSIEESVVRHWIESHPQTMFVVDESYIDFSTSTVSLSGDEWPNLIVLRSMTKSYALAGVRLGYLVAMASQVKALMARRVPWSVNEIAQSAGVAALESQSHFDEAMVAMRAERQHLVQELEDRGYRPLASDTGFMLIPVDDAVTLREQLLGQGVLVRDCHSFGIEKHIRVAVGDRAASDRLLDALDGYETLFDSMATSVSAQNETGDFRAGNAEFRSQLYELFRMRRDVRRFRSDAIAPDLLARWIDAACMAPSVGLSQPWRFVSVDEAVLRDQVAAEFDMQNQLAAEIYGESDRADYQQLKLAGLREAPVHLAVFVEPEPEQGRGLGRQTMPETVAYSVVAAIQNFWLAARCDGVGVGWVSIVRPERVGQLLEVPSHWQLIAYLCVGYPLEPAMETPELELSGWQRRAPNSEQWIQS